MSLIKYKVNGEWKVITDSELAIAYAHAQKKGSEFLSGFYKIETNSEGHVVGAIPVTKSDITALDIISNINIEGVPLVLDENKNIELPIATKDSYGLVKLGQGGEGKIFKPSTFIDEDGRKILHWEIVDEPGEPPEDIVIGEQSAEWTDVEPDERGDKYSDYIWEDMEAIRRRLLKDSEGYTWDSI